MAALLGFADGARGPWVCWFRVGETELASLAGGDFARRSRGRRTELLDRF